jgi:DNA-binding NarL/FixJ family response regulator
MCRRRAACDALQVPLRVLIVDDSRSFLDAARVFLERERVNVVGVASTETVALTQAARLRPDVVLVDITLAGESGFSVARGLVEEDAGGPPVILISTHAEDDFADLIADSPAIGFLPKSGLSADAIRRVLDRRSS